VPPASIAKFIHVIHLRCFDIQSWAGQVVTPPIGWLAGGLQKETMPVLTTLRLI
jgi:hypothetical protein